MCQGEVRDSNNMAAALLVIKPPRTTCKNYMLPSDLHPGKPDNQ